jgi:hypothetical protein
MLRHTFFKRTGKKKGPEYYQNGTGQLHIRTYDGRVKKSRGHQTDRQLWTTNMKSERTYFKTGGHRTMDLKPGWTYYETGKHPPMDIWRDFCIIKKKHKTYSYLGRPFITSHFRHHRVALKTSISNYSTSNLVFF